MAKSKLSFTLDGIKYTDISGYTYEGDSRSTFNVNVAGTAQMIRQYMKQKYPNIPIRNYYWVQSESYSGGDSIRVYLNGAPKEFSKQINEELIGKFEEGKFDGMTDSYTYTKSAEKSEEGRVIDYGTKYLFVNNQKPYGSDAPSVDWEAVLSAKPTPSSSTSAPTRERKSYPMGEVLKDCAGWTIYKKTLPDGRIVYNAKIKPETAPNRTDWAAIKGEVYTDTGFKWGKFGAFEKWGTIPSEAAVIDVLCRILGKYYDSTETSSNSAEENNIGLYLNGEFIQNVSSEAEAFEILKKNFGEKKLQQIIDKGQVFYNMSTKRVEAIRDSFVYGKNWGVPSVYGNLLQFSLIDKGFKTYISPKNNVLVYYKKDMATDGFVVNDNGGEFNVEAYGYNTYVSSVNYTIDDSAVTAATLADRLNAIYEAENQSEEAKPEVEKESGVNESYKSLPANPKLEYCKINWAEGKSDYVSLLPREFQSFTALSKFIADNIGEIPKQGYDKHGVEWKWKFEDVETSDRWDVSEKEANPNEYPNLFASEILQKLCYYAWVTDDSALTNEQYDEMDKYYGEKVGKVGFEINKDQFIDTLDTLISLYPEDKLRFKHNTPISRHASFKNKYPKLYDALMAEDVKTESPTKTKEDIEKAIKGLEYLAKKGNENAIKAIKGLKYLLNK